MPAEIDKTCCMCTSPICRHLACSLDLLKHRAGGGPKPPLLPSSSADWVVSTLSIKTWDPGLPCFQRRDFETESYELTQALVNSIISSLNFIASVLDVIKWFRNETPSLSCTGLRKQAFFSLRVYSVSLPPSLCLLHPWPRLQAAHCLVIG